MKTKKIALLSFLACACLIGGAVGMNANSVSAETPVVTMKAGASLRVPVKGADADADKDGIKFRATFDIAEVEKLEGEKSVGMFIAPADYYEAKEINADTCFGAGKVYCWGGATAGMTQIVHVEGYACKLTDDATVLTMDASLWNLKTTSLGKEFVGVAYLKAGDAYYFAEPAYATPVSVAQQALLNANDTIYNVEGDEEAPERVEAAYIAPYLGEGKTYTYTENVYKQQRDGRYESVSSEEKEIIVTSWNTEAEVEAPAANYVKYDGKSSSMVMKLVGNNTKNVYFNYAGNRVVLWDGDNNTSDTLISGTAIQNGMYEGNHARLAVNGWTGPKWSAKLVLPAPADTFSAIVKAELNNFVNWDFYVYSSDIPGNGYMCATKYVLKDLTNPEEITTTEVNDVKVTLEKDKIYKITMTFPQKVATVNSFQAKAKGSGNRILMDNICAENIKAVSVAEVPHIYKDTLTFPAPEVIDTTIWDGDESDLTPPVVKYKANNAGDYSTITAKDGVYTITPDASAYKYEIVVGDQTYTSVKGVSLVNFNDPIEERGYIFSFDKASKDGILPTAASAEGVSGDIRYGTYGGKRAITSSGWAYANKKQTTNEDGSENYGKNIEEVADFVPTKIGYWLYVTTDTTFQPYTYGTNSQYAQSTYANGQWTEGQKGALSAGYHYVEATFEKTLEGTYAIGGGFQQYKIYLFEIVLIP